MKTVEQVFDEMIEVLKQGWTQYAEARDAKGFEVGAHSPQARSWCLLGAYRKVVPFENEELQTYYTVALYISEANGFINLGEFNDSSEKVEEVIEAVEKAKELYLSDATRV